MTNATRRFGPKTLPWWLVAMVGAIGLGLVFLIVMGSRFGTVHVLNGLDSPLKVELGGTTVTVEPKGRHQASLAQGPVRLVATTEAGEVVDDLIAFVRSDGENVFNPGGAALLFHERITYSRYSTPPTETVHCGEHWSFFRSVDYPFTDPPSSISTKSSSETRDHLGVDGTLDQCIGWLQANGKKDPMRELFELRGRIRPDNDDAALLQAIALGARRETRQAMALLSAREGREGDRQMVGLDLGLERELAAEYRAKAAAGDPAAAAWLALSVPAAEGAEIASAALEQHPNDPDLVRALAQCFSQAGRHAEAAPLWGQVAKRPGWDAFARRRQADALVRSGKPGDAYAVLMDGNERHLTDREGLVMASVLAARVHRPSPTGHHVANERDRRWAAILVGQAPLGTPPPARSVGENAERLATTLRSDPTAALNMLRTPQQNGLAMIPRRWLWALRSHAQVLNDLGAADQIRAALELSVARFDTAEAFFEGGPMPLWVERLELSEQSALWFSRGQRLRARGDADGAHQAFTQSEALDPFGTAGQLFARWPTTGQNVGGGGVVGGRLGQGIPMPVLGSPQRLWTAVE